MVTAVLGPPDAIIVRQASGFIIAAITIIKAAILGPLPVRWSPRRRISKHRCRGDSECREDSGGNNLLHNPSPTFDDPKISNAREQLLNEPNASRIRSGNLQIWPQIDDAVPKHGRTADQMGTLLIEDTRQAGVG